MQEQYIPAQVEADAQEYWDTNQSFKVVEDRSKEKFYCLAMFFPLFGFFYWLTDVKGKTNWFDIIKPAGTATLTCYIIPYIWYAVQQLLHLHYPEALGSGVPGLLKSLMFSLVIVGLTGLLVKGKIKLKV